MDSECICECYFDMVLAKSKWTSSLLLKSMTYWGAISGVSFAMSVVQDTYCVELDAECVVCPTNPMSVTGLRSGGHIQYLSFAASMLIAHGEVNQAETTSTVVHYIPGFKVSMIQSNEVKFFCQFIYPESVGNNVWSTNWYFHRTFGTHCSNELNSSQSFKLRPQDSRMRIAVPSPSKAP